LKINNINNFKIEIVYKPAWTTDWMTQETKEKLRDYGISPPEKNASCPQCKSKEIELISEFGATACKSMYKCNDCLEPFEHFKCI
jgi:ring-1,2-phenylacetyl-CoA epoxidase subunit PaaD